MKGHILVIDDEHSMVELLETDLALRGYRVSGFTSSTAALETLAATDARVVLTDFHMPGVNGLQVCERFVANRPDIPVVVMTAFGSMETAVEAIRVGAWDFVTKPIEMELLVLSLIEQSATTICRKKYGASATSRNLRTVLKDSSDRVL